MCTLTWTQDEAALALIFSRDERLDRSPGLPPRVLSPEPLQVVGPQDSQRGGSWLVVGEHGLVVAVLNRGSASDGKRSRGELPLRLALERDLCALVRAVPGLPLADYPPFQIVAFQLGAPPVSFHWDGRTLEQLVVVPPLVTSSSLEPARVERHRALEFERYLARQERVASRSEPADLLPFHLTAGSRAEADVLMSRVDAATVSVTQVLLALDRVRLVYRRRDALGGFESPTHFTLPLGQSASTPPACVPPRRTFDLGRMVPQWAAGTRWQQSWLRMLRWVLCERTLNARFAALGAMTPREFPARALAALGISVRITGPVPSPDEAPIYVANHPLGGLDGLALFAWVLSRHGALMAPVNAVLTAIPHLQPYTLAVRRGKLQRALPAALESALQDGAPLVVFPAGATSRRTRGEVLDPPWDAAFTRLAERHRRPVVVVHISGRNSGWFYGLSTLRRALGIPWNLEMLLLPREMLKPTTTTLTLSVRDAVPASALVQLGHTARARCEALRADCYAPLSQQGEPA